MPDPGGSARVDSGISRFWGAPRRPAPWRCIVVVQMRWTGLEHIPQRPRAARARAAGYGILMV
jgi:hypothetical protein